MLEESAVVDSTVWISALHFGGTPRRALDIAGGRQTLVCSNWIRVEVERNLKFGWSIERVGAETFKYLGTSPNIVTSGRLRGVCRDPKDDAILERATVAEATIIISGDRDLLDLHPCNKIEILTPRQYLDRHAK